VRASRSRPRRASRGTPPGRSRRRGGCAGRRRVRRGSPGTARGARRPDPRGPRATRAFRPCVRLRGRSCAAPGLPPRRAGERRRVGGSPGDPAAGLQRFARDRHRGAAAQAERRLGIGPCEGRPIGIVDRPERLARRGGLAGRVARAAPEDRSRAARPPRHEPALLAGGAGHLERELLWRRRPVLLDEAALGVAVASDERSEPSTPGHELPAVGRPAGRAWLAHPGQCRDLGLLARERP
jgi:hypothetical protein